MYNYRQIREDVMKIIIDDAIADLETEILRLPIGRRGLDRVAEFMERKCVRHGVGVSPGYYHRLVMKSVRMEYYRHQIHQLEELRERLR